MGLAGLIVYTILWDVYALSSKGRHCTISSDCWRLSATPLRKAGFWAVLVGIGVHLARRPV